MERDGGEAGTPMGRRCRDLQGRHAELQGLLQDDILLGRHLTWLGRGLREALARLGLKEETARPRPAEEEEEATAPPPYSPALVLACMGLAYDTHPRHVLHRVYAKGLLRHCQGRASQHGDPASLVDRVHAELTALPGLPGPEVMVGASGGWGEGRLDPTPAIALMQLRWSTRMQAMWADVLLLPVGRAATPADASSSSGRDFDVPTFQRFLLGWMLGRWSSGTGAPLDTMHPVLACRLAHAFPGTLAPVLLAHLRRHLLGLGRVLLRLRLSGPKAPCPPPPWVAAHLLHLQGHLWLLLAESRLPELRAWVAGVRRDLLALSPRPAAGAAGDHAARGACQVIWTEFFRPLPP